MSRILNENNYETALISSDLQQALKDLKLISGKTMDLNIMEVEISRHKCAVVSIEGMASTSSMAELVYRPLMEFNIGRTASADDIYNFLTRQSLLAAERKVLSTYGNVFLMLFSGFAVVFVDGCGKAVGYGIQGYDKRSIEKPESEVNIKGSHDSFIDVVRTNISLVRRRMKSPKLRFDMQQVGKTSKTDVCVAYLTDKAPKKIIDKVKRALNEIELDTILSSGYIQPFLESGDKFFSEIYTTERPDVFCSKLNEGRVGILIDGTPFALLCPALFVESFQTVDDYVNKSFYTVYIKWIKYIAFFLASALPGTYIAIATFHPEMLTNKLLLNLVASEESTPYNLLVEGIIITIMYELMREAGIRLPKAVGGAVSIVGALIIGDAAVSSSLISAPLLIIIGLTATSSFVIPDLNQQTSVLRLLYIVIGGVAGLFGISILSGMLICNICSMNDYGVPYTAPVSPMTPKALRDILIRAKFKRLQKEHNTVTDLNGVDVN